MKFTSRTTVAAAILAAALANAAAVAQGTGAANVGSDPHHPSGAAAGTSSATQPLPSQAQAPQPPGQSGMGMMGGSSQAGGMAMPMMGGMMDHMQMMTMMQYRIEGRLAFLMTELAISTAQLPQWNAYADLVRTFGKARSPMGGMMGGGMMGTGTMPGAATPTWPDRLAAQEQMLEQRLGFVKKLKSAAAALYAALDDQQKKTWDELMMSPMGAM
jgi:hypothetical protein